MLRARLGAWSMPGMMLGFRWLAVLMALLAALLVLMSTAPHGIALSPDSVGYISVARSLSAGMGLTMYDSSPLTVQPPLYPAILSLTESLLGLDPVDGARIINAGVFGLIVYFSGLLFRRYFASLSFVAIGLVAVLLSPVLFRISIYAWTEPIFILLSLLFLLLMDSYLEQKSTTFLLLLAIVTALACLTRYIGVTFVLTGAAAILFLQKRDSRLKLFHLLILGAISVAPLGVWAVRNYLLTNTFTGERFPSQYTLFHNLYFALIKCISWLFPVDYLADNPISTRAHLLLGAVAGYLVGAVWPPRNLRSESKTAFCRIGPIMLYIGVHVTFLVVTLSIVGFEPLSERYLSPLYIPVVLTILFFFEQRFTVRSGFLTYHLFGFTGRLAIGSIVVVILVTWLVFPAYRVARMASQSREVGLGYTSVNWRTSETIRYVREQVFPLGDDLHIFSNTPEVIYMFTNAFATDSPEAKGYGSSEPRKPVDSIAGSWPESHTVYLVWFDNTKRPHLYNVDELSRIAEIRVVAAFEDGTIYKVSAK